MSLSVQLLADPSATFEEKLFASQSISHLARKPLDTGVALETLIQAAQHHVDVTPVCTQLSMAIAGVIIRAPAFHPTGSGVVVGLQTPISLLASSPALCLQVLGFIAEDVAAGSLAPSLRASWAVQLRADAETLLVPFIQHALSTSTSENMSSCAACLLPWLSNSYLAASGLAPLWPYIVAALHATFEPCEAMCDVLTTVCDFHVGSACAAVLEALFTHPHHHAAPILRLEILCARAALQCADTAALQATWGHGLPVMQGLLGHADADVFLSAMEFWADAVERLPGLQPAVVRAVTERVLWRGAVDADGGRAEELADLRKEVRNGLRAIAAHAWDTALGPEWLVQLAVQTQTQPWPLLEAVVGAASALVRQLFPRDAPETASQTALLDLLCTAPALPGLQRTGVTLLGLLGDWLATHPAWLPRVLDCAVRSLALPETHAVFPMRIYEDHVGAVALLKLAPVCGAPEVAVLADAYRLVVAQPVPCLTRKSARLVLQAVCQVACRVDGAAAAAVVSFLFQQLQAGDAAEGLADLAAAAAVSHGAGWSSLSGLFVAACGDGGVLRALVQAGLAEGVFSVLTAATVHGAHEVMLAPFIQLCGAAVGAHPSGPALDCLRCCLEAMPTPAPIVNDVLALLATRISAAGLHDLHEAKLVAAYFALCACVVRGHAVLVDRALLREPLAMAVTVMNCVPAALEDRDCLFALLGFVAETIEAPPLAAFVLAVDAGGSCWGASLLRGLLGPSLPSWTLDRRAPCIHKLLGAAGDGKGALMIAAGQPPSAHAEKLLAAVDSNDLIKVKQMAKTLSGGKKKGASGMPAKR